jgi:prepilin-type N-terminal cleavage/methylation domain-containing protein
MGNGQWAMGKQTSSIAHCPLPIAYYPSAVGVTSPARPRFAFTLIELIVVIVIVAIMAGVAVPTLSTLGASRARMAARQLHRDVTFARQRAMSTGIVHWLVLNTSSKTWTVMSENSASPGRSGASALTDPATGKTYVTTINTGDYVGVTFSSVSFDGGVEIGFDWQGKPRINDSTSLASQGLVVFNNGSRVTVEATTGYAGFTP